MKKLTVIILTFFLLIINICANAAQSVVKKDIEAVAADKFNMKATLEFKKVKGKTNYPTVVLIHSFGTNSQWWLDLPDKLTENGFAVLKIDLRGHGKSIYTSKLNKVSWKSLTNNAYAKYPDDVKAVIEKVQTDFPKMKLFENWAIVASDIGASAGIIASDKLDIKPSTIVILNPVVKSRSLYIPVNIANLDNTDFLSISSETDNSSLEAEKYLKRFAQKGFVSYTSPAKSSGMVILKNDPKLTQIITEWIKQYLK